MNIEYGRTCKDIGCLPSEVCVIAQDSCSYHQQDGKECGTYPTCKKSGSTNSSPGKRDFNVLECFLLWVEHSKEFEDSLWVKDQTNFHMHTNTFFQ